MPLWTIGLLPRGYLLQRCKCTWWHYSQLAVVHLPTASLWVMVCDLIRYLWSFNIKTPRSLQLWQSCLTSHTRSKVAIQMASSLEEQEGRSHLLLGRHGNLCRNHDAPTYQLVLLNREEKIRETREGVADKEPNWNEC
jgi:hypothetical protein